MSKSLREIEIARLKNEGKNADYIERYLVGWDKPGKKVKETNKRGK